MERFLLMLSVHVTALFRDPSFYLAFRRKVIPLLRTYPFIRIWHAGCSTGEEVYSMAILLQEEGLYERCRLYATDMNEAVLAKAKEAIFPLEKMQDYTKNYQQAGGTRTFSNYYTAAYDRAILHESLKTNIIFAQHNLATDGSFNEFHVVFCRNVLIYFNKHLQDRVHQLLYESLGTFGILALGSRESLRFTPHEQAYHAIESEAKLYRKLF
jgi:chemotaxis protein methyltransferase CheR